MNKYDIDREEMIADYKRSVARKRTLVIIFVLIILLNVAAIGIYFYGWSKVVGRFLPNTSINGVDVSNMTLEEAVSAVSEIYEIGEMHIAEKNGDVTTIALADFDYRYDIESSIAPFYDDIDYSKWYESYFKMNRHEVEILPEYDEDKLRSIVRYTTWGMDESRDAYIIKDTYGYVIRDEIYGDRLDSNKVADYVLDCFSNNEMEIDLTKSGLYRDPSVKASDLKYKVKELNDKFNYSIIYDFGFAQEELRGDEIYKWIGDDGTISRARAKEYIAQLAHSYDTFMTTRHFQTTNRGIMNIDQGFYSTGQYGWWMDQEKTVDELIKYIEKGESVTIEPKYVVRADSGYTYKGFASGRSATSDIGDTYIEVDLSSQKLWYYRNGELLFETDQIVSGKYDDPDRKTPYGIYSVYAKEKDYTMKTPEYSVKCKYFMRISFEGIGFHDLSRTVYGGLTYMTNGSHGCINMKEDEVAKLYELVERGTPVVMYY